MNKEIQNKIKTRRIKNDMKLVNKNDSETVWVEWKDNDIAHSIICGPSDTPYAHGFHGFDFRFDNCNYPFQNPKVKFHTFSNNIAPYIDIIPQLTEFVSKYPDSQLPRLHPNLYQKGYVCLSLLGTWRGDGWSSCYNILTICSELQQLLCEDPLCREPGHEHAHPAKIHGYNLIVAHANLRVSVLGMLKHTPIQYEVFRPNMIKYFHKHFDSYIATCDKYINDRMNGTIVYFKLYRWEEYVNFGKLKEQLIELKDELI